MDERDKRRVAHLKRLQERHTQDHKERFDKGKSVETQRREKLTNDISADWNKKRKAQQAANAPDNGKPLPEGWRDAPHWKTLQAMAFEFAGVEAKTKDESVKALEAYEARHAATAA